MRARALAATALAACLVGAVAAPAVAGPPSVRRLTGTFRLRPGTCVGNRPGGSYLSVTFGTRAIRNTRSSCDGGAVTLLTPGSTGLSTQSYSPASDASFNSHGDARSTAITQPVNFDGHKVGLVTASRNLQDGPNAAPVFLPPKLYVIGNQVVADVRSVQALYGGIAGSSCASASGYGCWLIGAERATGTYNAATRRMSLTWFSGQSFAPASAGTEIHLVGTFVGAPHAVAKGTTVDLGTSSFAAGPAQPVAHSVADAASSHHARSSSSPHSRRASARRSHRGLVLADSSDSTTTGSPSTFLIAEIIVELNVVAFFVVAYRRRRR